MDYGPYEGLWKRLAPAFFAGFVLVLASGESQGQIRDADLELVLEVTRELFPEIDTEIRLPREPGSPSMRLTAWIAFSEGRNRIRRAFSTLCRFSGGASLDDVWDREQAGRIGANVRARGGWTVGSLHLNQKDPGIIIELFDTRIEKDTSGLPNRTVVPEPVMWLFPL